MVARWLIYTEYTTLDTVINSVTDAIPEFVAAVAAATAVDIINNTGTAAATAVGIIGNTGAGITNEIANDTSANTTANISITVIIKVMIGIGCDADIDGNCV